MPEASTFFHSFFVEEGRREEKKKRSMASSSSGKGGLPPSLDLVAIMRAYVDRALSSSSTSSSSSTNAAAAAAANSKGMKMLVLDASTTRSVASAAGQSDLLAAEVYLTEAIENWKRGGEKMPHLKVWRRWRKKTSGKKKRRPSSIDR